MVSGKELYSRVQQFLRFNNAELKGLIPAMIVTAFILSFDDWGETTFNFAAGIVNLFLTVIVAGITFFARLSLQKIYAFSEGYDAEFKVWWAGLVISLIITFFSVLAFGNFIPLILTGGLAVSLNTRQRLGEFRYGFSNKENAIINFCGILMNMILAIVFAVAGFFIPGNYFLEQGMALNLWMGLWLLLPLPWLEGLTIFFGSRLLYGAAVIIVILNALLLFSGTKIGLIIAVFSFAGSAVLYLLTRSGK